MAKAAQKITSSSTAEYFSKNLQQVGFSSTTVTSHSSRLSWRAIVAPTLPQPMISAFMCMRSVARDYPSSDPCGKATIKTSADDFRRT